MFPVKICGITRKADAQKAVALGAAAIGFIFYPKSPRYITYESAGAIVSELDSQIRKIGVFVDENVENIEEAIRIARLDLVQLHGNESPDFCEKISVPVIKAFRIKDENVLASLDKYQNVHAYLFDTYSKNEKGGSGKTFRWDLVTGKSFNKPVILAGGLHNKNIHSAIETVHPQAVDISSGVEDEPGIKNHEKLEELFKTVSQLSASESSVFTSKKYQQPDTGGHYGRYGGKYVPETLIPALNELEAVYLEMKDNPAFVSELNQLHREYSGRPSPLTLASGISDELGYNVYLKREDLNHTGAHKINNTLGQILLARKMGKTRIIAETGAGQHGVATATVAAKFGLDCIVYMGEEDIRRQRLNVFRMELLGAEVRPVKSGSKTLKDATNEAIRDWVANVENTYYIIGSVVGPHPYPMLVRDFQSVIGQETRDQSLEKIGKLPDTLLACVGGGSNAMGLFYPFLDTDVKMIGVEASGFGVDTEKHAATLAKGSLGIFHGAASMLLQDEDGQVILPHSISAGLDYPGIGPEHSYLRELNRVQYLHVTDDEAVEAFQWLSRKEGIIPALESAHALAALQQQIADIQEGTEVIVCLSGRGDKDVQTIAEYLGRDVE